MVSPVLVVAEAAAAAVTIADTIPTGQVLLRDYPRAGDVVCEVLCAALAAVFTITWLHPIDVVKTRIQISSSTSTTTSLTDITSSNKQRKKNKKNRSGAFVGNSKNNNNNNKTMISSHSPPPWTSYYRGITVAWIAEAVYYGLQLGLYEPLKSYFSSSINISNNYDSKNNPGVNNVVTSVLRTKILAGALAGLFGALTGNPFVILRTRMVANDGERRNIASFVQDVIREDSLGGFYKGFTAMFLRAIVLSATKMVTYDTCKSMVHHKLLLEGVPLQFVSAFIAGLFITATVMPFDMIRTRMMLPSARNDKGGNNKKQTTFVQSAKDIYNEFGICGFYRGAVAFCVRIAPKTCLQFLAFEYLKQKRCLS